MNLNLKVKVKAPMMPNFIVPEDPTGIAIPISELNLTQAKQYAELMRKTFMEHWEKKVEFKNK